MAAHTAAFQVPADESPKLKMLQVIFWVFLLWTIFGLLAAFQMYANTGDERPAYPLMKVLHLTVGDSWLKAAITIPLIALLQYIPITRDKWKPRLVQYLGLAVLFLLVHVTIRPLVIPFVLMWGQSSANLTFFDKIKIGATSFIVADMWGLSCIVLLFHAWRYQRQIKVRELHEERLQSQLARAELQILKMQLQPHFLFNTLNTIYNLAPQDSRKAQRMIARLSELLRLSLDHVSTETVPLQRELEFLNSYLEIEKTRFEERLKIVFDIDPETLDAEVPNMILQPLVENSIRHGIGKKAAGGTIRVSSKKSGGKLVLLVTDDGKGLSPELNKVVRGIGLANTKARLNQLYGNDFYFQLSPAAEGTRAVMEIPFQTNPTSTREEIVL